MQYILEQAENRIETESSFHGNLVVFHKGKHKLM